MAHLSTEPLGGVERDNAVNFTNYEAGHLIRQTEYDSFIPTYVNHGWDWQDVRINTLLEEATQALGELNAFSRIVPDVDLFIQLHVVKEANASSRIEGTRTEMDEAIRPEEEVAPERRDDWREVQNYIQAMGEAIDALQRLPLSTRLLKQMHRTLMQGVRGRHKKPGSFRSSQNWIGGASLQDAAFIPPPHHQVPALMSDLEKFWHNEKINVPHLIRVAISHYQFETIHPFLDGNGRIGRLLITLYLINCGMLEKPSLYLSSYIERHKQAYFDSFTHVRATDDVGQWVRFFLVAVRETARGGCDTFEAILNLSRRIEHTVAAELGQKAGNARQLLVMLYRRPFVRASDAADQLGVTHTTAMNLIRDFERLDILHEITGNRRNRRYMFTEYFNLFTK